MHACMCVCVCVCVCVQLWCHDSCRWLYVMALCMCVCMYMCDVMTCAKSRCDCYTEAFLYTFFSLFHVMYTSKRLRSIFCCVLHINEAFALYIWKVLLTPFLLLGAFHDASIQTALVNILMSECCTLSPYLLNECCTLSPYLLKECYTLYLHIFLLINFLLFVPRCVCYVVIICFLDFF